MKQKKQQMFIFKLNSSLLELSGYNLTYPLNKARKTSNSVVSLADSQILTWINEINGTQDFDTIASSIKKEIKFIKKQPNSKENQIKIQKLYSELDKLQFKEDYVVVHIDKKEHYKHMYKHGFKINGISYRRLLCTVNGVKQGEVVFVSEKILADGTTTLVQEIKRRINNGRNLLSPIVPAKLEAYMALCSSASVPVSWPKGTIVVRDCEYKFTTNAVLVTEEEGCREPVVSEGEAKITNSCDGCGIILPTLAKRWTQELDGDDVDYITCGFNLRCAFTKGMVFAFDFIEFAEKINGASENNPDKYIVTDVWGTKRDVREAEMIITENQFKLSAAYSSWEEYYNNCIENNYTYRIAKTSDHELDEVRSLNYQFSQCINLSDDDIEELIYPTVSEVKDIMGMNVDKTIVYLCGNKFDIKYFDYTDPVSKVLMANQKMIADPYIHSKIKKMVDRRIRDMKIGVIDVNANYQILSGDLYGLCQSIFGLEVTGILNSGEIYSQFWKNKGVKNVMCARAPMSNAHSLMTQSICYDDAAAYWFRYMNTVAITNLKDCMAQSLNGFDFDGDLLFTTDNSVLLRRQKNLLPIVCSQKTAGKKITTEDDLFKSNIQGFGSKIGHITNKITAMTNLMANYKPTDKEYQVLKYRTQCGQKIQQDEIDSAKGVKPFKMPPEWEKFKANYIKDGDSDEEIERKLFNSRICAEKYPYFFQYRYLSMKRDYDTYKNSANSISISKFNKTVAEIKNCSDISEEERLFLEKYNTYCPMDESPGVQNRICWAVENNIDSFKTKKIEGISCLDVLNCGNICENSLIRVRVLCEEFKKEVQNQAKKYIKINQKDGDFYKNSTEMLDFYVSEMYKICPNEEELCDILIKLCYKEGYNKEILWHACGDVVASRFLNGSNGVIRYPECITGNDIEPLFVCCGKKYTMKTIHRGDNCEQI